ncbi:MAG TPA: LuxR C-terminal-related transcriptional regulator [Bacillota bacterium]
MEKAKKTLGRALEIGRTDRIILPFAEYGFYILDILKALKNESGNDAYLDRLVKETARYSENLKLLNGAITTIGELTEREQEILQFVASGQTNQEIAAGMHLAEITVKKNISAINRKLEVGGTGGGREKGGGVEVDVSVY